MMKLTNGSMNLEMVAGKNGLTDGIMKRTFKDGSIEWIVATGIQLTENSTCHWASGKYFNDEEMAWNCFNGK
jgi:hypothetical protein